MSSIALKHKAKLQEQKHRESSTKAESDVEIIDVKAKNQAIDSKVDKTEKFTVTEDTQSSSSEIEILEHDP